MHKTVHNVDYCQKVNDTTLLGEMFYMRKGKDIGSNVHKSIHSEQKYIRHETNMHDSI